MNLYLDTLYTSYLSSVASKYVYKSFRRDMTCIGLDSADMRVNPTISEKNIVTLSKCSAATCFP